MSEEGKIVHHHHHQHSSHHSRPPPPSPPPSMPEYGTFAGIPPSTPPETGFGRVIHHHHHPGHHHHDDPNLFPPPPPGARFPPTSYFPHRYQPVPGYVVAQGTPVTEYRHPCCGSGLGSFVFMVCFIVVLIWLLVQLL